MTRRYERQAHSALIDRLGPALTDVAAEIAKVAVVEGLLPGVEVRAAQGIDGGWFASVLLDKRQWPEEALPEGRYVRTDNGSGRWWYDPAVSLVDFHLDHETGLRTRTRRTPNEARALLDEKIADLLTDLAMTRMRTSIATAVPSYEHHEHHQWTGKQDQREPARPLHDRPKRLHWEAPRWSWER